uniref:Putative HNH endonuclease n=1 Tax=viral metagenome TaxID=1070528 RepID=A0A6M3JWE5_9ZZZZ
MPLKKRGTPRHKDRTGQRFGRLVAIKFAGRDKWRNSLWEWHCDCGNTKIIKLKNVLYGETKTRSCGCLRKELLSNRVRKGEGEASFNVLYKGYKFSAKRKQLDFELDKDSFRLLTQQPCFYCGREPSQISGDAEANGLFIYNGIDRLDSTKGYIMDNCVTACGDCNLAKRRLTVEQFLDLVRRIYHYRTLDETDTEIIGRN